VADHEIIGLMLAKGDKKSAIAHVKGSRYRDMGAKADRGNIVHAAFDQYLSGKPMTKEHMEELLTEAQVPQNLWHTTAGMISGVLSFLDEFEPEVYQNESTLYSRKHGYAGTADFIGKLHVGKTRVPVVLDVKTSPRIYDEVALQLVAYARADFVGHNDGSESPLTPDGEEIRHGIVLRPKADGTFERADFSLGDDLFELFLSVLGVTQGVESDVLAKSRRPTVQ
jgi:hypothetical protein